MASEKEKRPSGRQDATEPDSGSPGGGAGRRDEVGRSGVYPVSGPWPQDPNAKIVGEASWGQGERGAAGYEDSGESELHPPQANAEQPSLEDAMKAKGEGGAGESREERFAPEVGKTGRENPQGSDRAREAAERAAQQGGRNLDAEGEWDTEVRTETDVRDSLGVPSDEGTVGPKLTPEGDAFGENGQQRQRPAIGADKELPKKSS